MATIQKSLSTKKDGQGYSQVLFRVSIDKNKKLRLKTGVLIPEKRWDETKGQLSYSRTVGAERKEMAEKDARLKNIEGEFVFGGDLKMPAEVWSGLRLFPEDFQGGM